jgi:sulfur relay protein TusB/DsrH
MLVLVTSSPETKEAKRGLTIAQDLSLDLVLMQNAVYLTRNETWGGFGGKVYAMEEDVKLRGATPAGGVELIGYDRLVELISESDKVIGMF